MQVWQHVFGPHKKFWQLYALLKQIVSMSRRNFINHSHSFFCVCLSIVVPYHYCLVFKGTQVFQPTSETWKFNYRNFLLLSDPPLVPRLDKQYRSQSGVISSLVSMLGDLYKLYVCFTLQSLLQLVVDKET